MLSARVRLASLWLSQVARVLADWCLRTVAFLGWAGSGRANVLPAWHTATAVFIAPFILLAPLNGCVSNGLPRRKVLLGSAAFALLAVTGFAALHGSWMACLGVAALGAAVYSPARYAVLPAASADTHIPLPRVNGWIEMGGASAIVGGAALGWYLAGPSWPGNGLALPGGAVAAVLGLNLLCLLTALPVSFPSDVPRPEPPARAVAGFFRDTGRIFRVPAAAASLLGLAGFQAVVTAGSGGLIGHVVAVEMGGLVEAMVLLGAGAALGCVVAALLPHPRRNLGFVALGATGLLAALGWAAAATAAGAMLPRAPCLLLGFTGALVNVPLRSAYLAAVPADARGNGMAVMNTAIYVLTTLLALLLLAATATGLLARPFAQLALLAGLTAVGAAVAWRVLLAPTLELLTEIVLLPVYRIRAYGPGRDRVPPQGPVLVVANHSAYMDPLWLGKIIPRKPTPLMTSVFYDKPVIHWLMVHVVGAIRVPEATFRREAPELRAAADVLRRGGCLLVFPEGGLRRRDDQLVRHFGQGVWHVLRELPQTPVVVCWIEGGWGSFTSYHNGPPMRNKRMDWWRPIRIGVAEPQVLDPAVLADQRATRASLRRACLGCRRFLGLDVPAETEPLPEKDEGQRVEERG